MAAKPCIHTQVLDKYLPPKEGKTNHYSISYTDTFQALHHVWLWIKTHGPQEIITWQGDARKHSWGDICETNIATLSVWEPQFGREVHNNNMSGELFWEGYGHQAYAIASDPEKRKYFIQLAKSQPLGSTQQFPELVQVSPNPLKPINLLFTHCLLLAVQEITKRKDKQYEQHHLNLEKQILELGVYSPGAHHPDLKVFFHENKGSQYLQLTFAVLHGWAPDCTKIFILCTHADCKGARGAPRRDPSEAI
ncbi:hypothetical protein VP01_4044g1 [Puccinia sorghi]|uniref:Uncharacterized protein n=1 Tax=Puccinia sorghi TaxID=27349 RepID=A0A0L6URR8_9BASI|nr:hypothetical protein VP01_4044g1 [Puccinia sorghi]